MSVAVVVGLLGRLVDNRRLSSSTGTIAVVSSERPARALIVTRLSRVTDNTTSPERQLASCRELITQRGYSEVGIAEDLDVSGSVDPFDRKKRPRLAEWLHDHSHEFDVLIAYRVDRFTRSLRKLQELVHWCDDNGKTLVSATEPHFDTTTPFAAVVIALMGTVAEMELEAISERTKSSSRHLIRTGRYRGSVPPWGYAAEKVDGEWRLVPDPAQTALVEEVARRVIAGESLNSVCHDFTRRGVKTPKGKSWNPTPMKRSLISEAMLGRVTDRDGKAIRGDDGSPITRAEPIIDREVWTELRDVLASRSKGKRPATQGSLLTQVIFCGIPGCGRPAYRFKSGGGKAQHYRYRCQSAVQAYKCRNRTIRADDLCQLIESTVIGLLGDSERLERVWSQGSDNSDELAELNELLEDLTDQLGTGMFKRGTPERARLDDRIRQAATRRDELASEPQKPSGWTWESTGEVFGPWWAQQDVATKNGWLRAAGVRVEFDHESIRVDLGDVETMLKELHAGPAAEATRAALAAMTEAGIAGMELLPGGKAVVHTADGRQYELQEGN
ncbi:recombinase family protein [Mycobacterium avium subsp. hominissuis]|uniref:Recombinase family protein n=2 Tax=Mycobacterium avium TaxID=1764 RepID=A0A2A3L196_MYCAV|nr:recombinase family protein [Mycobacterium avium subsp. hominissuis]PBA24944.1 recombinase family protein [Mycobacterium avium]MCA4737763.1 recombinase family protein [Mycobacterium avium subsp. hominissuis]MCA4744152.1 recombinase family protein [Mycobacterium avium subsp. hominissuis]MCA4764883.1 recombinase family protein [Mycobacterium avium subsp. hominissuis]